MLNKYYESDDDWYLTVLFAYFLMPSYLNWQDEE